MTNLTAIETQSEFLAFIKDESMANGNLSIRGVARCCGVHHTSLIRGGALKSNKLSETLASKGFHDGALTENGFPPQAVWLCIEYFAYESQSEAPMAKQLARTFGAIGIMATLDQLNNTTAMPTAEPTIDPIEAKIQQAIALAAAGPLAVEAFKILNGIGSEPKPAKESKQTKNAKTPIAPPLPKKSDDEVISEFLADLKVLIDAGIVGSWNVTTITRQFKPYLAVALQTVVPAMEKHFKKSIDRKHLEAAIKAAGGVNASTQRFKKVGDERKATQAKCALLPDRLL